MNAAVIIMAAEQWRGGQAHRANILPTSISGETKGPLNFVP